MSALFRQGFAFVKQRATLRIRRLTACHSRRCRPAGLDERTESSLRFKPVIENQLQSVGQLYQDHASKTQPLASTHQHLTNVSSETPPKENTVSKSKSVFLGLCAVATAACSSAAQPVPTTIAAGCAQLNDTQAVTAKLLEPGAVHSVRKFEKREFLARAIQPMRTLGADLYVHATPGVTPEYLERNLSCHAAQGTALSAHDPFLPGRGAVEKVEVRPAGHSYAVRIVGRDSEAGRMIWQRASQLVSPGSVTVEQLAQAPADPRL